MVTIEELKLGNRTLEALKFLLSQITELETAVSQINISEIKEANTLTKEQIATLQDVKSAVEAISSDLNLKKSDFDEKKQIFDINMSAFINDKADFDEKKADFDSKNNTALSNFAFISSNVEKINSTSALLAEAKTVLEAIKPMEQRTQAALDTIVNSQAKFAELEALKTTLLELKRSLENISTTGLITDTKVSTTQTYSSKKIEDLVSNAKTTLTADIKSKTDSLTTIMNNQKQSITTLDSKINSTQGNLNNLTSSVSIALEQKADKTTFNTFVANTTNNLNLKANKNDVPSVTALEATFMKKTDKIDAYTKRESDDKFALKTELQKAIPVGSYLLYSSNSNIPDGFLRCDGSALDKNTYAALFSVLGYTYGRSGDKFLLPNFADGKFMRGTGGNAAALGTAQQDAIRNITGSIVTRSNTDGSIQAQGAFGGEVAGSWWAQMTRGSGTNINFDASRIVPTANENRPYNMAVVVLIKY
jgi:putative tail fiber protein